LLLLIRPYPSLPTRQSSSSLCCGAGVRKGPSLTSATNAGCPVSGGGADLRRMGHRCLQNDPSATWLLARATCNRRPIAARALLTYSPALRRELADRHHAVMEETMGRKFIDCRQFPSEMNCTIAISADTEVELLDAAVQHAVAVHRHQDTPELRDQIRSAIKEGTPS
jgi:predicted small metal-binding protein